MVNVGKMIDLRGWENKCNKESEPWWKRKINKMINQVRKRINILERHQRREIRKKEIYKKIERKYNKKKKGIRAVIEELKQRLQRVNNFGVT